jgi:hypothetical protein
MSPEIQGEQAPLPDARRSLARPTGADPAMIGFIDLIRGNRVSGWALDRAHPELPVEVRISVDGREAARVPADRFRRDLERGGFGSGHHAFEATLPIAIGDGEAHRVEAFARSADGAEIPLVNRPATPSRAILAEPRLAPEADQILLEIRALRERIEVLAAASADGSPSAARGLANAQGTFAELETLLPSVGERLDGFDVVQARLEAAISRLEDRMAAESRGLRPERGLRIVVGLLGVLSLASLLLGLRSLLS